MAVTYVQSVHNATNAVTLLAKAYTSNNTSGNTLLCCVGVWKSGIFSDPTITDSRGNTWKLLLQTPRQFVSGQSEAYLFVAYNCALGANTVTVNVGVSSDIDMAIFEYSGIAATTALDQIAGGSDGVVTRILSGTIQTQHANEVVFSFAYDQSNGTQTFTTGAGWTAREQTSNPGAESLASYDKLASSTGTFTNTISISSSNSNGLHSIIASLADSSISDPLIQIGDNSNASTTSLGVTFPINNTSGNLLLLAIGRWVSTTLGTITSVTDTRGNTWTLIGTTTLQSHIGNGQSQAHLYSCASCVAGANTVTVATSSSQDLQLAALEYSPAVITAFIQNAGGGGTSAINSIASGSISVGSGLAIFSLAYNQSHNTGNYSDFSGRGWRNRLNQGDTNETTISFFDQVTSSISSIEQTITVIPTSRGLHVLVAAQGTTIKSIMEFLIT